MKIECITLREIGMPLLHFFETSFGRTYQRRILLVSVQGEGLTGWGECVAGEGPFYSEESVETAWYVIGKYLAPALLGRDLGPHLCPSGARLEVPEGGEGGKLWGRVREHRMAKAALENALWDAAAQARKIPLWQLLGGTRREIACGVSIGIQDSVEQLLEKIATELASGYQRIKVKVKPGWDIEVLRRIRERWPEIPLSCDANSAYTLADVEHLKKFDSFKLLMMEQPLWHDDVYFHAVLQKQIGTAICLDESIHQARDARAAAELGACRVVNIKVGRVGGFSNAIAVHDVCRTHGIPVWCGGMLESGVGRSHNIALSTLENFSLPGDVSASKRYWKEDIIEPEVEVTPEGVIRVPHTPGRGYRVRQELIERLTVKKEELRATSSAG